MNVTQTEHKVKHAATIRRGGGFFWFVVECACGWSSKLHGSSMQANAEYAAHKNGAWGGKG